MTRRRPIGVGVVGLGAMGTAHLAAYAAVADEGVGCRVVAVCDRNFDRRDGLLASRVDPGSVGPGRSPLIPKGAARYADPAGLFADSNVDAVSICTRTESHVALTLEAASMGKHVLVEKPLALTYEAAAPLLAIAGRARPVVMPAMCMRFWPGWTWLKERVVDGAFGRVKSAVFRRVGAPPTWSTDFYGDPSKSGGALVDLHIHDADFVRHLFAEPVAVVSTGGLEHVTTLYEFGADGPPHVVAEGGQTHAPGSPFTMRYTVAFERATADFDVARAPRLVLTRDGNSEAIEIGDEDGYVGEVRAFLGAIANDAPSPVLLVDALKTTALIDAERRSALTCKPVALRLEGV